MDQSSEAPLLLLDGELVVIAASTSFCRAFRIDPALAPGRSLPVLYVSGDSGHEWTSKGVPSSIMVAKPFAAAQIVVGISSLLITTEAHW